MDDTANLDARIAALRALPAGQDRQDDLQALFAALRARGMAIPPDLEERSVRLIVAAEPENQGVLQRLFELLAVQGKEIPPELEEQALLFIARDRPDDLGTLLRLFEVMRLQGKAIPLDLEEQSLRLIVRDRPDDEDALLRLFKMSRKQGKAMPAELEEQALRLIVRDRPEDRDSLLRLCDVLRVQGKEIPPEIHERSPLRISDLHPFMSRQDVFRTLYLAVEYVYGTGVEGDIAEFGTMTGWSAEVLAKAMATFGERLGYADLAHGIAPRRLMLFDSFVGLPAASTDIDRNALHVRVGLWAERTCSGLTSEQLARLCGRHLPAEQVRIVEGWFSETLPTLPEGQVFGLVHIDSDLYESARDVLVWMFENDAYADGCALLFDDWDCNRASPEFGERKAWSEIVDRFNPQFTDCGPYGFVSRRFILHRPRVTGWRG
ncbi:MAG: hypothetical protein BroJett030_26560 [Alphaproteobacteria bacterium]|nr:MAG: hypothetical protein BroJett030_26560 [Alphaproteobacteria bacterium]